MCVIGNGASAGRYRGSSLVVFSDQPHRHERCTDTTVRVEDTVFDDYVDVCTQHSVCWRCKQRKDASYALKVVSYNSRGINLICPSCREKRFLGFVAIAAAPALAVGAIVAAPVVLPAVGGFAAAHAPIIAHAVVSTADTAINLAVPAPLSTVLTAGNDQMVDAAFNLL